MLQPEQKHVNWMIEVVLKFDEAEELVVNTCRSTLAIAKAYL